MPGQQDQTIEPAVGLCFGLSDTPARLTQNFKFLSRGAKLTAFHLKLMLDQIKIECNMHFLVFTTMFLFRTVHG